MRLFRERTDILLLFVRIDVSEGFNLPLNNVNLVQWANTERDVKKTKKEKKKRRKESKRRNRTRNSRAHKALLTVVSLRYPSRVE